jgi:GTP-binding protein
MPKKIEFIKSAVLASEYPVHKKMEVAIAGRSNAGKSSFINALDSSKIAKVSNTPGKTRLLNFFDMANSYVLVDMPGYGFASRSGKEINEWEKMVETFLSSRECLKGLLLVMDIRRSWTEEEELMKEFTERSGLPLCVILTKADKISRSEMLSAVMKVKKQTGLSAVFPSSTLKKHGYDEVEKYIYENWIK